MKPTLARYAVLKYRPIPNRSEHVNYGIVTFSDRDGARVHLSSSLGKIRALDPSADLSEIRQNPAKLIQMAAGTGKTLTGMEIYARLCALNVLEHLPERELGSFLYMDDKEYQGNVSLALRSLCNTQGSVKSREPKSRLFLDVKKRFSALGIMATNIDRDSLPDHQVMEFYTPDPDVEVKLEFALQNGALRAAQTVDLRPTASDTLSAASKNSAMSKAFSLSLAKQSLPGLIPYLIVAGSQHESARRMLNTLEHTHEEILVWESSADMSKFFSEWADAAGKPMPAIPIAN